jgi:hypothetical protein
MISQQSSRTDGRPGGIPDLIPAEACYLGRQQSPQTLTRLAEPNIEQ